MHVQRHRTNGAARHQTLPLTCAHDLVRVSHTHQSHDEPNWTAAAPMRVGTFRSVIPARLIVVRAVLPMSVSDILLAFQASIASCLSTAKLDSSTGDTHSGTQHQGEKTCHELATCLLHGSYLVPGAFCSQRWQLRPSSTPRAREAAGGSWSSQARSAGTRRYAP